MTIEELAATILEQQRERIARQYSQWCRPTLERA